MRYRICRRYSPTLGTWFVIQKRKLWWWITYYNHFKRLDSANLCLKCLLNREKIEEICETPLIYKGGKFIEKFPCETKMITF